MSDTNSSPQMAPQTAPVPVVQDELRAPAIAVYILYLAAVISAGVAGIVGVIVAYVKRDDAKGTVWESHYKNQIEAFWVWLVLFVVGILTVWVFFIGLAIIAIAFIWFLYRTIKGLLRAMESQPYV
jgi:uncharacterized membrane protein